MYKFLIRPFLFLFDPENVHHFTFRMIRLTAAIPGVRFFRRKAYVVKHDSLKRNLFGLEFINPVGLAAGFDKNARMLDYLGDFGFGFIEIGTVTPKPQPGNPKPRLFRLKKDQAIINRMGFNNDGADAIAVRLQKRKKSNLLIGGNIGKNKVTPNEQAEEDYVLSFEALFDQVDYFVVNVSSPNTPGLRDLQEKEPLKKLLNRLQTLNRTKVHSKPILLKIAPDLTNEQLDDIIEIVTETKIAGVIATNTTIERKNLLSEKQVVEQAGGLSGRPVRERSTEVIRYLSQKSGKAFPIIGVGGIHSAADALEKIDAGATLVQVYTGFIYEGPALVKRINKALIHGNR
ncbi:MAG: quinone-dependent dihydroorotate dehydrogenase [Bacteroidetes bacterium]|nr:quinone-dependent dihydroorotate dehydrogenase [Bacteroidota bacterium]